MARASFPVTSARAFAIFFASAFRSGGAALIDEVKPVVAPVTFTTASNSIQNSKVREYFMNSGSAQTLTVPSALTNVAVGESITITVLGAGVVTLAAGGGVTLNKKAATLKSDGQYSRITLKKISANVYVVNGDLAAS